MENSILKIPQEAEMTNWKAMQVPKHPTTKEAIVPHGIKPKYLAMGSFHADAHKEGKSRRKFPGCGGKD